MIHNKLRNKLLIVLLSVALIPFLAIAITLYNHHSDTVVKSTIKKLETVRNLSKKALHRYFTYQHDLVEIIAQDSIVKQSFQELYELQKRSKISDNARFPFQSKDVQNIYKKYDDYINWYIYKHNFLDMYYVEASSGQIIYTVMKHGDIGANLKVGSLKKSALAWAFYHAIRNRKVTFEDMYDSSEKLEDPSMLMSIPVIQDGKVIGVIVLKFGFEKVNEIVASHLGDSKEEGVYIIGDDNHLRSSSSFAPISMSVEQSFANRKSGKIISHSIERGLKGEEGSQRMALGEDNQEVLSSYTPIYLYGTTWVILSETLAGKIDEVLNPMLWIIILITGLLIALMIGLAYYLESKLLKSSQSHISSLAYSNQGIGAYIDSIGLSLSLLSNRAEDKSLVTTDMYGRFDRTLDHEKKLSDVIKVSRILGKRVEDSIAQCDKKMAKTRWQFNQVGEATEKLYALVERIDEISLQTNLIAFDIDTHTKEHEGFVIVADKTKDLSLQMAKVSKDTQDFIKDSRHYIDEGKTSSNSINTIFEVVQDNVYKLNQLMRKYAQIQEKNLHSYEHIFSTMKGIDTIADENVFASKQLASEMQELHKLNRMMYEDIIKISETIGIDLEDRLIGVEGISDLKEYYLSEEREDESATVDKEYQIAHELSKL